MTSQDHPNDGDERAPGHGRPPGYRQEQGYEQEPGGEKEPGYEQPRGYERPPGYEQRPGDERPPGYEPAPDDEPGYERRPGHGKAPSPGCAPGKLDDLTCYAKGVEAEAAYNKETLEALTKANDRYKGARKAYSDVVTAAAPKKKEAGKQLDKLVDQIKCLIDAEGDIDRLDTAYGTVKGRLERCESRSSCYPRLDCRFDRQLTDCPPADLPGRIADVDRRTKAAEACFKIVIEEPTTVTTNLKRVQDEIADITAKIATSTEPAEFRRLYAMALVARRHLSTLYGEYADVNAYVDRVCQILTCMVEGHSVIAELKRRDAVHQCREDARLAACDDLGKNTVEQVMAEYLRTGTGGGGRGYGEPADTGGGEQQPDQGYAEPEPEPRYAGQEPDPGYAEPEPDPRYAGQESSPRYTEQTPPPRYAGRGPGQAGQGRYADRDDKQEQRPRRPDPRYEEGDRGRSGGRTGPSDSPSR